MKKQRSRQHAVRTIDQAALAAAHGGQGVAVGWGRERPTTLRLVAESASTFGEPADPRGLMSDGGAIGGSNGGAP